MQTITFTVNANATAQRIGEDIADMVEEICDIEGLTQYDAVLVLKAALRQAEEREHKFRTVAESDAGQANANMEDWKPKIVSLSGTSTARGSARFEAVKHQAERR